MNSTNVLFLNCTLRKSPEISNTEALWQTVAELYQQQGCQIQQLRMINYQVLPGLTLDEGPEDEFPLIFEQIQKADILVVGTPVLSGMRSSECQKLIERLQGSHQSHLDPATGQPALYNKLFGLVLIGDASGGDQCIAQTCQDFNRLGCINLPNSTVAWFQPLDTPAGFIEAGGQTSIEVNRTAQLWVDSSLAMVRLLHQAPLKTNLWAAAQKARTVSKAAKVETATLMTAKVISTPENCVTDGIDYRKVTKRIWTMMQAGQQKGFEIKILSLEDRIFRAEREGKGFIYKIYPGHFSFRRQYQDYDYEQSKSRKLALMQEQKLPVPVSYGTFKAFADIPLDQLTFPIVAKPDSGSLSQNVFPNLRTPPELQQAVAVIEGSGGLIKLESHISGRDYRVLIINHQYAGCVERRPANVTGDGKHTILELFHLRNQEPGRAGRYEAHTTLHQIVFDQTSQQLLQQAGYTLETVLPSGELFFLQEKITASTGSDYVDCTEQLHSSIVDSCTEFSYRFSTLTLGFDLITTDITRPLAETGGAFNEYNFLPYVDLHENCNIGQKRQVCKLVWDYIEENAERIVTPQFDPF